MADLLERFVQAFDRAIAGEMAAMRDRMGPFEVEVTGGRALPTPVAEPAGEGSATETSFVYEFDVSRVDDKLVAGTECTLRRPGSEVLVTIAGIGEGSLTLRCERELRLDGTPATLVIYPWFLYERLRTALSQVALRDRYFVDSGLRLFGKIPPERHASEPARPSPTLNPSQQRAVTLCRESDLAFVWGPPGTGKTHTLAAAIAGFLASGERVLLTSTTNAAIDQALGKLAEVPELEAAIEWGEIVRIGRSRAETHGAALGEVVARRMRTVRERLAALRRTDETLRERVAACEALRGEIEATRDAAQGDLFGDAPTAELSPRTVALVFSVRRASAFAGQPAPQQLERVARRRSRLQRAQTAAKERGSQLAGALAEAEREVVASASLVVATMTNVYLSRLLEDERYDVVIVDEAGMAVLPTLFYCAALARKRVLIVGDPRQLPPIVQSREAEVQRFMGRSIFEVTVPDPHGSPWVALLDTQYRMHPAIGDLVSRLYYDGALHSADVTLERDQIAALAPAPGHPIVVVDTSGTTQCATRPGSYSRLNEASARLCVELARQAIEAGQGAVAIITPYAEQARVVRRRLEEAGLARSRVECATVHRFQGHERDVVILDAVDTEPLRPGVLLASRDESARKLLNVSLSRARGKLVLVADVAYFSHRAPGSAIERAIDAAISTGYSLAGC